MKRGVLQYAFVRPVLSIFIIAFKLLNIYHEGAFNFSSVSFYVNFMMNLSVTVAMYYLVFFFFALKQDLKGNFPVLKFTSIKLVVFVTFWQNLLISILVSQGIIKDSRVF